MHFDDHEIIVPQLAGRKKWTFAPNTQVVNPTANSGRVLTDEVRRYAQGPGLEKMPNSRRSVSMEPGSVLFLPRGDWRETDAPELSISLTFGFRIPCWAELMTGMAHRMSKGRAITVSAKAELRVATRPFSITRCADPRRFSDSWAIGRRVSARNGGSDPGTRGRPREPVPPLWWGLKRPIREKGSSAKRR